MRPVNLLPPTERPARAAAQGNGSYIVIGALGALLLALVGFVLTQNQINSRTTEISRAQQEQQEAEARAAELAPFGDFASIKDTRLASVTDLADARFDWERLMRELALVLPEGAWITEATTAATGEIDAATAGAPTDVPTAAGPTLQLIGCAPSQTAVAEVMVRLRSLHRAEDVQLSESARPDELESAGGAVTSEPTAASSDDCGQDYEFNTTVSFSATPPTGAEARPEGGVPASLGGGA